MPSFYQRGGAFGGYASSGLTDASLVRTSKVADRECVLSDV